MEKTAILKKIHTTNLTGIKAGNERQAFLNIWMVVVNDRIFARSWGLAERSWYNSFLKNNHGFLKVDGSEVPITAQVPADIEHMQESISEAYLTKYNHGSNAPYAQGIVQPQHVARTMEFVLN